MYTHTHTHTHDLILDKFHSYTYIFKVLLIHTYNTQNIKVEWDNNKNNKKASQKQPRVVEHIQISTFLCAKSEVVKVIRYSCTMTSNLMRLVHCAIRKRLSSLPKLCLRTAGLYWVLCGAASPTFYSYTFLQAFDLTVTLRCVDRWNVQQFEADSSIQDDEITRIIQLLPLWEWFCITKGTSADLHTHKNAVWLNHS